ncbi:Flp family type IVb pilin [Roseibium sp. RKSG952]|uniref:Flp family type IVb pilin n=1 Tax=Roseibium sp. RKSG952 TaxID=2529384 RepID=UPI0012BD6FD2|nr:hypothetical protein [Roseibium sp. RKSG952]MTH99259.1 hypothetical protein [Roseibium sp. RKSG952]
MAKSSLLRKREVNQIRSFGSQAGGSSKAEYALITALIGIGILSSVIAISDTLRTNYHDRAQAPIIELKID